MPTPSSIVWFKENFSSRIEKVIEGTPYSIDFIVSVACQETGEIWGYLRKNPKLDVERILQLCVGDTYDGDSKPPRKAFPRFKADLIGAPDGQAMFDIARQALVDLAENVPGYEKVAKNETKICHGFGIFQYDLQHFNINKDYFLSKHYEYFDVCLLNCVQELDAARKRINYDKKSSLTDLELCAVAIAYNTGGYIPSKGLKQGHRSGGRYYGELIYDYLMLAQATPAAKGAAEPSSESVGHAILPHPLPVGVGGERYEVETKVSTLRVRSAPKIPSTNPNSNVIAELPEGTVVKAVTGKESNSFLEIETNLGGAYIRGFCHTKYLRLLAKWGPIDPPVIKVTEPKSGIVAAHLPYPSDFVVKRTGMAGAHSLNEAGAPTRNGQTPQELVASIGKIIEWLNVDKASHKRYQPTKEKTFCNIYVHDFCALSGVYIPRVWWYDKALIDLAQGNQVKPRYGQTVFEARANDLFRWFSDHGPDFGWQRTVNLTELQQAANQGGLGVIVARRKDEGRSGHITMIAPESEQHTAERDKHGAVTRALESQAGRTNFRYGFGAVNWWKATRFADSAFWIHR